MEFTHTLTELYPEEIIEVRGNADALAVTLKRDTNIAAFIQKLKTRFTDLKEPQQLFIKCQGKDGVEPLTLK